MTERKELLAQIAADKRRTLYLMAGLAGVDRPVEARIAALEEVVGTLPPGT